MAICCFPNCAYLSETSRMVSVYKKLIEKGERALMVTHGGTYEFVFKEEGVPYHHIEPHVSKERSLDFVATSRLERGHRDFYSTDELREHVQSEINFFKEKNVSVNANRKCQGCRQCQMDSLDSRSRRVQTPCITKVGC